MTAIVTIIDISITIIGLLNSCITVSTAVARLVPACVRL